MKRANNEGSIYKDSRRGIFIAAVSVGYDPQTGRQIRRTKHARTKAGAVEALKELRQKYTGNTAPDGGRTKLIDWLKSYYDIYKRPAIRYSTSTGYATLLKHAARMAIATRQIDSLTASDIQAALLGIDAIHTRRKMFVFLRAALRQAVNDGAIIREPTSSLRIPPEPRRKLDYVTATPEDAQKLIAAASDEVMRVSIQILYSTGMRAEEMLGLTWAHFDRERPALKIRQAVNPKQGGGAVLAEPKTRGSSRDVTIPRLLARDLIRYQRWQREYIMARRDVFDTSYNLIVTWDGRPLPSSSYSLRFKQTAQRAGVSITPRGLRHTHATQLFGAGWSPKDVQKRLGHSTIRMTMDTYTHYIPERADDIAAYMDTIYPQAVS